LAQAVQSDDVAMDREREHLFIAVHVGLDALETAAADEVQFLERLPLDHQRAPRMHLPHLELDQVRGTTDLVGSPEPPQHIGRCAPGAGVCVETRG